MARGVGPLQNGWGGSGSIAGPIHAAITTAIARTDNASSASERRDMPIAVTRRAYAAARMK